ncbi:M48 family metallopeptidase [Pontiella sp. NLcol2]|uniref:M48 family metallopeptidase n=2 Tax=Pontiella agarivorans TaxID=3038953 RepID=A0ABU5N1I7_9BACT|nr:M48 family metallopeptidase [Pontiella agarivorans]
MDPIPANRSLAYLLGRRSAPLFLKANWIFKALAGSEKEKISAEFQMGLLLAQAYEEKVPTFGSNRLDEIAAQLTARLRNKNRQHRFRLDQSGELNACAIPGGFIYVSEKLFDLCGEDTDAIAFVLAHEMAHGIHGDANERYLTKTVISGLLRLKTRGLSPGTQQLLARLIQQGYSREQEFRADRFAVALTRAAGFDPEGGCRLFSNLRKTSNDPNPFGAYLSSHPPMDERIKRIEKRIKERA